MRYIYIPFLLVIFFLFFYRGKIKGDDVKRIDLITANYMMNSETPYSIPCDKLESQFICASFHITDKRKEKMVLNNLNASRRASAFDQTAVDTRARMYITYQSGKTDTLCFGVTDIFKWNNQAKMLPNRTLINFLFSLRKELGKSYQDFRTEASVLNIQILKTNFKAIPQVVKINGYLEKEFPTDTFFIRDKKEQKMIMDYIGDARKYLAIGFSGLDTIRSTIFITYESGTIDTLCFGKDKLFYLNYSGWKLPDNKLLEYLDKL